MSALWGQTMRQNGTSESVEFFYSSIMGSIAIECTCLEYIWTSNAENFQTPPGSDISLQTGHRSVLQALNGRLM